MRQRLAIVITIVVVIGVLVALSSASYVHVERTPDSEFSPDRSTMNSGATGTRALYDFLHETGHRVIRWREPVADLLDSDGLAPSTFVIIGRTRRPIDDEEAGVLLYWVAQGGRLVIVDRLPEPLLLPHDEEWTISAESSGPDPYGVSADDLGAMTSGVNKVVPAQPTLLTSGIESILPSRFVSNLKIAPRDTSSNSQAAADEPFEDPTLDDPSEYPKPAAPVVHFADENGALLVDFALGKGRIVLLAEPFILANNGISSADNLQLAINVVAGDQGLIAFDEFHQGRSVSQNALIAYFAGTPIIAMCAQLALLVLVVIWTKGRRFARPLPLAQVDRRSSLEFVASMAELQERARAYDLALENIYGRTRRVLARYAGAGNFTTRDEIARRVSLRSRIKHEELETLMRNCEDVINGAPASSQSAVNLAQRLRAIEAALGLRMRSRETRQATEKL
jgi:hypothetical protein